MLVWNETDFITCLETAPVVGDHGATHSFTVAGDGLRLEVVVWQYDGDVAIKLFRDGVASAILELTLLDCSGVRYVDDQAGERLEFAPAKCFGSRYDGLSPLPFSVALSIKPSIQLRLFGQDV